MRKFSKLLAVLLTVFLLSGVVVSFVASADEVMFNITGADANQTYDFASNTAGVDGSSGAYKIGIQNVEGYVRLYYNSSIAVNTQGAAIAWVSKNPWRDSFNLGKEDVDPYHHMVLDFDLWIDQYRYTYTAVATDGTALEATTTLYKTAENYTAFCAFIDADTTLSDAQKAAYKTEAKTTEAPAVPQGMYFYSDIIKATKADYTENSSSGGFTRIEVSNKRSFTNNGVNWYFDGVEIDLSVGTKNHFTYVFEAVNNADNATYTVNIYMYANGEYVATQTYTGAYGFQLYRHVLAFPNSEKHKDVYSIAVDNIATNYYTDEALKTYGLKGTTTDKYMEVDGIKYYFPELAANALSKRLKDGDTLKTSMDLNDFNPSSEIKSFFIDLDDGATVTLAPAADKVFNSYLYDAEKEIYHFVNIGFATEESLNLGDSLLYNDFSSTTSGKNRYGEHNVTDGDIAAGIYVDNTLGYVRIYGSGGPIAYKFSTGGAFWGNGWRYDTAITMADSAYSVLDFDYGTDRYTFSYTADVNRTITIQKNASSYTEAMEATDMGNITLYMTVDSVEEYLAYVNGTKSLNGTKVTETISYKDNYWRGTQTDVITNAKIVEGSFKPAYIVPTFIMNNGTNKTYQTFVSVTSSEAASYISIGDNKIALSGVAGVTDHITVVFDNGITAEGQYWATFYVNGQYLGQVQTSYHMFGGVGVYGLNAEQRVRDNYSMMLDNIAFNQYATGYNTATAYGVDDLIADLKAGIVNPVYNCSDVLYKDGYIADHGAWATTDDFKTFAFIPALFAEELADGGKIITNAATLTNVPANVNSFTLVSVNAKGTKLIAPYIAGENNLYTKVNVGTQANVDLEGGMAFNLYVPNTFKNVMVDGLELAESAINPGYYVYTWETQADSFAAKTVIVTATYNDGTKDYEITFPVTLDVVKYAYYLAASDDASYKTLAKELVDYKVAAATYTGKTAEAASVTEFYNEYEAIANAIVPEHNHTATGDVKLGYVIDSLGKLTVVINLESEEAPEVKYVIYSKSGAKKLTITAEVTGKSGAWLVEDVEAAFIDSVFTVNGTSTYCLADYVAEQTDANAQALAQALLEFATAAKPFKVITE